tara:strand:- start:38 stop:493 length:456 start_codon:yes stop_codon:yes gene_type:complete
MSDSKWTTVNGVRYPVDDSQSSVTYTQSTTDPNIDPLIEQQNKQVAASLLEQFGGPVSSTQLSKGPKRTTSPPQKVPSPEKLRQQEAKITESITKDNFMEVVELLKPAMDEANRKAADIWTQQGEAAMLQHIMTREDGTPMSYAESRARYG